MCCVREVYVKMCCDCTIDNSKIHCCMYIPTGMSNSKVHSGVWWRNLKKRDTLEDLRVDERIILKWV